jgi:exodeoxyribonuclease III
MMPVTISSLNVNGIRAAERKGFSDWIKRSGPDIICLQELKAVEHQVPARILKQGYHGFFFPAVKKGYSGVGILTKSEPISVSAGMGIDWIDEEGRIIRAEFEGFRVLSVYAPSGTSGGIRQELKYRFLDDFNLFSAPFCHDDKPTILCGDFNIAHREIDIHNPVANRNTSGFLPEERDWFSGYLESGFTDAFRNHLGDIPDQYSWWTYRTAAKDRNKGWRIDYHLTTHHLRHSVMHAVIERELNVSDHVPVTITYDL